MSEPEILLVEDNPGDVRLIEKALGEGDVVHVSIARTGADAIRFLRREGEFSGAVCPDIVILDLNLPSIDGRELLSLIKEDKALRHIPVIVLTSSRSGDDINHCYDAHSNCYIVKPTSWEEFKAVVQEIKRFWLRTVQLPRCS